MFDSKNLRPKPGNPERLSDLRVYNIIAVLGSTGGTEAIAPIIFQNYNGLNSAREALLSLHRAIKEVVRRQQIGSVVANKASKTNKNFETLVHEYVEFLQRSRITDVPGIEYVDLVEDFSWSWLGIMVTGVCVTIENNAAEILSSEKRINQQCDLLEGKKSISKSSDFCLSIKQDIVMVTEIKNNL